MNLSMMYHLESNGKIERTNRIIEDIFKMYVMDQPLKWENYIHLVEFSYNHGYQASLIMSPFEALYGRKCNTLVSWNNPIDRDIIRPDVLKEMEEKMERIEQNLAAQNRHTSYANKKRCFRYLKVGEHVFLKVKAIRSSISLGCFPKLAAR
jgi:hypothetical protein